MTREEDPRRDSTMERRSFLRLLALGSAGPLLAACVPAPSADLSASPSTVPAKLTAVPTVLAAPVTSPAAAASAAPPPAGAANTDWQALWDRTMAAAKQEGRVVVLGPVGELNRRALDRFQKAHPDIVLELTQVITADVAPRVLSERRAGEYRWDVHVGAAGPALQSLKPEGVLDPLRPAMLLPDVLDDRKWFGGFHFGWADAEKQSVFAFQAQLEAAAQVNRDLVPESDLVAVEQLINPEWKGKIAIDDPKQPGPGQFNLAFLLGVLGEGFARTLLQQDLGVTANRRQLVEWLVRGRYPIAIGTTFVELTHFQQEGLGTNLRALGAGTRTGSRLASSNGNVMLINRAPHPHAARVFINWLLSREGGLAWREESQQNSRRTDVPPLEPVAPRPGVPYFTLDTEESVPLRARATELAKQYIG